MIYTSDLILSLIYEHLIGFNYSNSLNYSQNAYYFHKMYVNV